MRLYEVLREECVRPCLDLPDKQAVLKAVAETATRCPDLSHVAVESLLDALAERERLGSTGIGNGVAVPHCRIQGVTNFVVGLLTITTPVPFESIDGEPVSVVVFIIAPKENSQEHIRILSEISHALKTPGALRELQAARHPPVLAEALLRFTHRHTGEQTGSSARHLLHLFVQDEELFRKLLECISAMELMALSVVEARPASEYLAKVPLFAGFVSDRSLPLCWTVTALVDKELTNETLRRIEEQAGPLTKSSCVAVAVQEVFYAAGCISV